MEQKEKKGLFARLKEGLGKTRNSFTEKIDNVFSVFKKIDDDLYDELEEALIMADIGGMTSCEIVDELRARVKEKRITDGEAAKEELKAIISEILSKNDCKLHLETKPSIVLVIGVNGVGKLLRSVNSQINSKTKEKMLSWRRQTLSVRRRQTNWKSGLTAMMFRLYGSAKVQTLRLLSLMPVTRRKAVMLMFVSVTLQEDFTTRKTLWMSLEKFTELLTVNFPMLTRKCFWCLMQRQDKMRLIRLRNLTRFVI